jgi:hypothetical protein
VHAPFKQGGWLSGNEGGLHCQKKLDMPVCSRVNGCTYLIIHEPSSSRERSERTWVCSCETRGEFNEKGRYGWPTCLRCRVGDDRAKTLWSSCKISWQWENPAGVVALWEESVPSVRQGLPIWLCRGGRRKLCERSSGFLTF